MNSAEMVKQGYADAVAPRVEQVPHRRAWRINGEEYTDLDLFELGVTPSDMTNHALSTLQLMNSNVITRQEALERMTFT